MASVVSSWKSQGHLGFICPRICSLFSDLAFFQDSFSETGTTYPSCSAGWKTLHHSPSVPPLYPGHYQVMATLCLSPVLLQTAADWPSHVCFPATNLHSPRCTVSSVENNIIKQSDDIILH